ncbi:MAG TPA: 3-phosphoshikimate 1-carboxyvinyltransferase [Phycisphaerales bacterium]|nr:3-phosphoshikimate 1-carboxyvinyltransferase [Phycisphaerales bacterium]
MPDRAAQIAALRLPLADLPDPLPIPTIARPFDATIRPPGSKSITNRALLLAALADGVSELRGPLIDADDSQVMLAAIRQLGARVEIIRGGTGSLSASDVANSATRTLADEPPVPPTPHLDMLRITGVNGRWTIPAGQTITLNLHNAGTATRFLTAAAILSPPGTSVVIDGDARMRERPIADLADALRQLGVGVEFLGAPGCPPLRITPPADLAMLARSVTFDDPKSSQFISAIMLIAPFLARQTTIEVRGPMVSEPYIGMSRDLLGRLFAQQSGPKLPASIKHETVALTIPVFPLKGFTLDVEPDASGATYFEAAAALILGARTTISGLDLGPSGGRASLQGDTQFVSVLTAAGATVERLNGALRVTGAAAVFPLDINLEDMPDTAMTAAVMACFASPTADNPTATSMIRGLRTLRVKETDRLAALKTELSKLGAAVEITRERSDEGLRISPPQLLDTSTPRHLAFDTYNDHRMAMSLALIGLRVPGVRINNPGCVAKTYPTFWRDFAALYR